MESLPDDILVEILLRLSDVDIAGCRFVCQRWNAILSFQFYWMRRVELYMDSFKSQASKIANVATWEEVYKSFGKNLLFNDSGSNGFEGWTWSRGKEKAIQVEDMRIRAPGAVPTAELADSIFDGDPPNSCFVTSHMWGERTQRVNFKQCGLSETTITSGKLGVRFSEIICSRFDCGAKYKMKLTVKGAISRAYILDRTLDSGIPWHKVEMVVPLRSGDETAIFHHGGRDTQFWAGMYGVKFCRARLELCLLSDEDVIAKERTEDP